MGIACLWYNFTGRFVIVFRALHLKSWFSAGALLTLVMTFATGYRSWETKLGSQAMSVFSSKSSKAVGDIHRINAGLPSDYKGPLCTSERIGSFELGNPDMVISLLMAIFWSNGSSFVVSSIRLLIYATSIIFPTLGLGKSRNVF